MTAANRKEYELLFQIKASLGTNFNKAFQSAVDVTKKLQNSLGDISKVQKNISGYKKQQDAIEQSKKMIKELSSEHDGFQKELNETTETQKKLRKELNENIKKQSLTTDQKELEKLAEEHSNLQKKLDKTTERKKILNEQIKTNSGSTENTTKKISYQKEELEKLQRELNNTGINTGNLTKENEKLTEAYDRVKKSQDEIAKLNQIQQENKAVIAETKGELLQTFGVISGVAAVLYNGPVQSAIEFQGSFAGVKKTVDATPKELAELENGIRSLAKEIPVSASELAALGESAGQLGIELGENGETILDFIRVVADLGVATNLAGEEGASQLAKFANIMNMPQDSFSNLGSTIVALGNKFSTTEADIVEMAMRIAGAGKQIGLSAAEVMALSTALSSVGIEAEMGGSAISKVMVNMSAAASDSSKLAEILSAAPREVAINADKLRTAQDAYAKKQNTYENAQISYNDAVAKYGKSSSQAQKALNGLQNAEINLKSAREKLASIPTTEIISSPQTLRELEMLADSDAKGFKELAHSFGLTNEELKKLMKKEEDLQNFAQIAGMTGKEFKEKFETDAVGALQAFIGGLGNAEDTGSSAIEMLEEMGINEVRLRDSLLRAANANDLFTDAVDKANEAWKDNSDLTKEANQRYETTESLIAIMKNNFNDIGISLGNIFLPQVAETSKKLAELAGKFSQWVQDNPETVQTITKIATGLAAVKVGSLGVKLGLSELGGGVDDVKRVFALFKGDLAETAAQAAVGKGKFNALSEWFSSSGKGIFSYFGNIKKSLGGVDGSLSKFNFAKTLMEKFNAGSLGEVAKSGIGGVISNILTPFKSISDKIGSLLSPVKGTFSNIFGTLRELIAKSPLSKIGGLFESLKGVVGSIVSGPLKGLGNIFGGAFSGLFGKIMPVILIVSLLANLFLKLNGGDTAAFMETIQKVMEDAKPVLESIMTQIKELGEKLMPLLISTAKELAPLFGDIILGILPIVLELIGQIAPLLIEVISKVLPTILDLIGELAPKLTEVITAILPVILDLVQTLLPIITDLVINVLPIISGVLEAVIPMIKELIEAALPVLIGLFKDLKPVIEVAAEIFSSILGLAIETIKGAIDGLMKTLGSIIDFISGVFTGDWTKAWEGIKNVFGGIWDTLVACITPSVECLKTFFYDGLILPVISFFAELWEKIKAPFAEAFEWFNTNVIQPIFQVFEPIVSKIGEIFAKLWEIITALFGVLGTWFYDNVIVKIIEIFEPVVEIIGEIFQNVWNAISKVFSSVAEWFSEKFSQAWEGIKAVFSSVGGFFQSVWDGIVSIFTKIGVSIGDAVGGAFKAVVNSVIGFAENTINKFIRSINKVIDLINVLPNVNIAPLVELDIPKLAKGSNYTPDTFIAGEKGAELITNAKGRKVFTAAQTGQIFNNINKVIGLPLLAKGANNTFETLYNINNAPDLPTFAVSKEESSPITINYNPVIHVDGNKPNDLEGKLKQNNEHLLELVKEFFRKKEDDERRMIYA